MIINLFEIPIFVGKIHLKNIKLKKSKFSKTWLSKTRSTFKHTFEQIEQNNIENVIEKESLIYLLKTLVELFEEKINEPFEIYLDNIWENKYSNGDYQEPHIHTKSDFSFIIYKEVEKDGGKTLFFNPSRNFIDPYFNITHLFLKNYMPSCKKGEIVLFPSFLEHMVLKTSNQHTISGNIKFKKK